MPSWIHRWVANQLIFPQSFCNESYKKKKYLYFIGVNCETNINDCQSSPCHRGECIDGENSFTCNCHPGFTGYLCQTQINECESDPCQYGGHCEDLINGYQCRCNPGTSGSNCEINVNECYSNPCRNGATCVDGINRLDIFVN